MKKRLTLNTVAEALRAFPRSRSCALRAGDATGAAGRPLHGGRWSGRRLLRAWHSFLSGACCRRDEVETYCGQPLNGCGDGDCALVALHGAQVLSWVSGGRERST
jgi:hypothetical protein